MEVIQQVLVVGIRVNGFDMSLFNSEILLDYRKYRNRCVGGTGCRRKDFFVDNVVFILIYTIYNVGNIALSGCGKQYLINTFGFKVTRQTFSVSENTCVVEGAARFAKVMKLAATIADKLKLGAVDNNMVTTDSAYILTRFIGDGSYYWGVFVRRDATLGSIHMLMKEYAEPLWRAVPR